MTVSLNIETPLQDDVRALVDALNDHLLPLSPLEFQFKMSAEEMAGADTIVFVARDETGEAMGMGALKIHADGLGEIKRMFTRPTARTRGVGSLIIQAIEEVAAEKNIHRLVLETGVGEGYQGAWKLYQKNGYTQCGAVLDYPDSGYSAFFEKNLTH